MRDMIEIQKLFRKPEYYLDMITMSLDTLQEKYLQATATDDIIFYGYLYQEKKCFGLDYNDLIKFSLYIFRENPDIRLKWQQRLDNLAELKQSVYEYETACGEEATLEHYLAHVALFTNSDAEGAGDKVKLMTVHAAKGLEFPYVFLCGMNEGVFPSRKVRDLPGMEEERRLAFVAMTRAEKRLYLSEARGRNLDGSPRYPSRFLLDIAPELIEPTEPPEEGLIREARDYIEASERSLPEKEPECFAVGQRVRHAIMGLGTVVEVDTAKGAQLVRFDGFPTPRAISFRAKLEPVDEQACC